MEEIEPEALSLRWESEEDRLPRRRNTPKNGVTKMLILFFFLFFFSFYFIFYKPFVLNSLFSINSIFKVIAIYNEIFFLTIYRGGGFEP